MALDTSIYANALMQPQKSALDYANDYAAFDERKQRSQQNALVMQQTQMDIEDKQRLRGEQDGVRNALQGLQAGAGLPDRISAIERLGTPTALSQADVLRKAMLDAQKTQVGINKDNAQTESTNFDLYRKRLDHGMQAVIGASSPELARQAILDGVRSGHFDQMTAQRELQNIPTDPGQYGQWRLQKMGMMLNAKDQLEQQWKQREFSLKSNNELIGPDGKPNTQLAGLKMGLARAGAANVSVNTGQKGLDNEFKLRGEFKGEPVYKAHQEMQSAYSQIKQSLGQGTPAADLAAATKIMKLLDPGSVVRESELGMAMAATGLMDRVQNYAQNIASGNKLTARQREEFGQLADALFSTSVDQFNAKRGEYEKLGGDFGLNAGRALGPAATSQLPKVGNKPIVDIDAIVNQYRSKQ